MDIMDKIPNWLRYILAIPFGIVCLYAVYFIGYFSCLYVSSPDSLYMKGYNFIYSNGINVLIMMAGMNHMLPKYHFRFTLVISIICCSIGMVGLGMNIITANITIGYILGLVLTVSAFIYTCYASFEEDSKDEDIENKNEINQTEKERILK